MSSETFIQKQIKIIKNKQYKNERGVNKVLNDYKEPHLNIEDINQEYLFDTCLLLNSCVKDIRDLNMDAYFIANAVNISEFQQLKMLKKIENEYNQIIKSHKFFLTFIFPKSFIDELIYIFRIHKELVLDDELINGISTAFVQVQYYKDWCSKNKISDKHFRLKKEQILKNKTDLERLLHREVKLYLPFSTQDILLDFVNTWRSNIPKYIMGMIVELISGKSKLPKPSKFNEYDKITQKVDIEINKLIEEEGISPDTLEKIVEIKKKNFQY